MKKQNGDKYYYLNIFGGIIAGIILLFIYSSRNFDIMLQFSKSIGFSGVCSLTIAVGILVSIALVVLKMKKTLAYFIYYWLILYGFASFSEEGSLPYDIIVFIFVASLCITGRCYRSKQI